MRGCLIVARRVDQIRKATASEVFSEVMSFTVRYAAGAGCGTMSMRF